MSLEGKRIAVLAENDYEDLELLYPWLRLIEAGAKVDIVGTGSADSYLSKHGYPIKVDVSADAVKAADYDGVVVPGGFAPDRMRRYPALLRLVRELNAEGKVVAAICHAGWVFVSAGILKGKTVTSTPAIKDDMINAGATWIDQEVVVDGNMVTSRKPGDLPAFMKAIIAYLGG
ncbi:MAG: type 1 glutamine amidotransferase [Chloroflexi bacterium]|nr:type 1 glutamine amidotransferase [Chloroflexota bacterium]